MQTIVFAYKVTSSGHVWKLISFVYQPVASLDSTAQTGNANGGDWQEEIYQKVMEM